MPAGHRGGVAPSPLVVFPHVGWNRIPPPPPCTSAPAQGLRGGGAGLDNTELLLPIGTLPRR